MHYTSHVWAPHEFKGKSANYNWCVEHMEDDYLVPNGIDPDSVMLTIIDADSWVPSMYIKEMNRLLKENYSSRHRIIFHPPQIFTQNHLKVPAVTRMLDMSYAQMHFSNLYSFFGVSYSLSNFSLSYQLAKKVGFWDTCPAAIADDIHTDCKVIWKTNGEAKVISIFTPFNQASLKTGKGYF
jgi:cellulose synthase/poly-beta-1,6-N-acetylglucosamine synthase-like glycosyltransferase